MPDSPTVAKLRERVRVHEDAIAMFERTRAAMQKRRTGACDSVMVHIDESLKLNARALDALKRVLENARRDLQRELNASEERAAQPARQRSGR